MSMQVTVHGRGDVVFVFCEGRLVYGPEVSQVRNAVLSQKAQCIMLDLESVPAIDAAGLGLLVELSHRTAASGGHFIILNATGQVRRLLRVANLESVLTVWHTNPTTEVWGRKCGDTCTPHLLSANR